MLFVVVIVDFGFLSVVLCVCLGLFLMGGGF